MKKNGKYRFSLQFGMESKEEITAGEFLERLGNKKSKFLVAALNEYASNHPELEINVERSGVSVPPIPVKLLELKINEILEQRESASAEDISAPLNENIGTVEPGLLEMIDDLELF